MANQPIKADAVFQCGIFVNIEFCLQGKVAFQNRLF